MATLTAPQITAIINAGGIVFLDCGGVPVLIDQVGDIPVDLTNCGYVEKIFSDYIITGTPTNGQVPSWNTSTSKLQWTTPSSGGGAWGTITGTLSNQTDLQSALNLKANLASPTFTGIPLTPTASVGTNTTQIASTAFVRSEVSALVNSAPSTLDTLNELATALGNDPNFATTITNSLAGKANLTDNLSVFAATTSLQLKNLISDETGSESLVFRLAPTLKNIVVNQNQNNDDMILATRATDSSPTGTFINFKNAATSQIFKVDIGGNTYSQGLFLNSSTGSVQWGDNGIYGNIRGFLGTTADGIFRFGDSTGGGSPQIILGSADASTGIRLKRSSTTLAVRNGDDTADASLTSAGQILSGHLTFAADNTYDIGASGTTRPRDVYVARRIFAADYISANNTSGYNWSSRGWLQSPSDGVFTWTDNAQTSFSRLQFGGITSSFPSLKRSSATLQVRLADDSDYAIIAAKELDLDKTITAGGTIGAQTINKSAGTVNFAAAATSVVVTNSLVTANSIIIATVATNDNLMFSVQAVAGSGSFTLYPDAAPFAETRVNFLVIN